MNKKHLIFLFLPYILIILIWAVFYIFNLTTYPLSGSEPLRIFISRELTFPEGIFTSTFMGYDYFNKLPIYSLILKLSNQLFNGDYIYNSRIVSSLSVLFTVLVSYKFQNSYSKRIALNISILILITSSTLYFGRQAEIDFISAGIIYLVFLIFIESIKSCETRYALLLGILAGLEFLIKTPFSILFLTTYYLFFIKKNKKNIYFLLIILSSFFVLMISYFYISKFFIQIDPNFIRTEILHRFTPLNLNRMLYERIRALTFYLPSILIIIYRCNEFKDIFYRKILKFVLIINLIFFLMPGFQAQYIISTALMINIPAGIKIDYLNAKSDFKINKIIYITILIALISVFILPKIAFDYRFQKDKDELIKDIQKTEKNYPIFLTRDSLDIFSNAIIRHSIPNSRIKILKTKDQVLPKSFFYLKNFDQNNYIDDFINKKCTKVKNINYSEARKGFLHEKKFFYLKKVDDCLSN